MGKQTKTGKKIAIGGQRGSENVNSLHYLDH